MPTNPPERRSAENTAKEIIEEMVHVEAWRDGLVVNDLPLARYNIVKALLAAEKEGYEKGQEEIKNFTVQEVVDQAKAEGFRKGQEQMREILVREHGNDYIQTGETIREIARALPIEGEPK